MEKIDTSIDGFRYVGINLTQEQYEDLCCLNMLLMGENRKNIPVFNTSCNTYEEVYQSFQRKFGKVKE